MQYIANDGACWRRDDADDLRQIRQRLLARSVEQTFGSQLFLSLFDQRHEGAQTRRFERLDHDLVLGLARKSRNAAGDHDLEACLQFEFDAWRRSAPHDAAEA